MPGFLELIEVVVHHRRRRDATVLADFADGGWVLVLALVDLNEIQDFPMAFTETLAPANHHHGCLQSNRPDPAVEVNRPI
jgi:hypothetical protein